MYWTTVTDPVVSYGAPQKELIGKKAEEACKIRSTTPTEVPVKSHKTMETFSFAPQSALEKPIRQSSHSTAQRSHQKTNS
jgi:hypothetical protein